MSFKLLFLRKFPSQDMKYLTENLSKNYELIIPNDFSEDLLVRLAKDADVFIGDKIFKKLIDAATKLKMIQVPGTGVESLDLELLRDKNISVCNSHSNASYVAEYAIALLFSLVKKINNHDRLMRQGIWFVPQNNKNDETYLSDSVIGRRVGFLGFGNIAQNIARFLSGFKPNYMAYRKKSNIYQYDSKDTFKIEFYGLKEILTWVDVLFITLPLTKKTENLISINELKLMKKTAYLVNVSRGHVVNQESLYEALMEKYIAGAAIDAWYDDIYKDGKKTYPSRKYPFHELENVVLSPHRAGYVRGSSPHLIDVVKNLTLFVKTNKLINIVDLEAGY